MSFLRRLLGSRTTTDPDQAPGSGTEASADAPSLDPDAAERAYEVDLLRGEQERLDELRQRQLRYAAHAWQPPAQGGERRADDGDTSA